MRKPPQKEETRNNITLVFQIGPQDGHRRRLPQGPKTCCSLSHISFPMKTEGKHEITSECAWEQGIVDCNNRNKKTFCTPPMHCSKWPYNCPPGKAVVQSLSCVRFFETPWTAVRQASLFFTVSQTFLKITSIVSVILSNHLAFCHPFLLLLSIFPSIRILSNESALHIRWPKY